MLIGVCRIGGFAFDFKNAGFTFVYVSGRRTNVGLLLYAKTRKRQLIDALFQHVICISYDRVLEISTQLGESVLSQFMEDGVVCPAILQKGLFTAYI
jgi:hypothetical protein